MKSLTQSDLQDLKSRKLLTDLLDEQMDINEEIIHENRTLSNQQKQLILLLESKDSQINHFKIKNQASDNIKNYLYERSLKLSILDSIFYRLQQKLVKQAFDEILMDSIKKNNVWFKLQLLSASYHSLNKKRFIKTLNKLRLKKLLLGFMNENNDQRRRTGLNILHLVFHNKTKAQLLNGFCILKIKTSSTIENELNQSNISKKGLLSSRNININEINNDNIIVEMITASTNTDDFKFNNIDPIDNEHKALILNTVLNKIVNRIKLGAIHDIKLKPIQKMAANFGHLKNLTKKFLAISAVFNLMRRMQVVNYTRGFQSLTNYTIKSLLTNTLYKGHCHGLAKSLSKPILRHVFLELYGNFSRWRILNKALIISTRMLVRSSFERMRVFQEPPLFSLLCNITNLPKESHNPTLSSRGLFSQSMCSDSSSLSSQIKDKNRATSSYKPNHLSKYNNKAQGRHSKNISRHSTNPLYLPERKFNYKSRYHILLQKYKGTIKGYSAQMKIYLSQMNSKIKNFQILNENLMQDARESREKLEEHHKNSSSISSKKEIKLKQYIEELESRVNHIQHSNDNHASLSAALKNKLTVSTSQINEYEKKISNLSRNIDELARDKGELLEKCEELMNSMSIIKKEFQKNREQLAISAQEKEAMSLELEHYNKLKSQYAAIEDEIAEIRKLTDRRGLSGSQSDRSKKDISGVKDSIKKFKKEKQDLEEELNNAAQQIIRLKSTNSELTKETISLNEERIHMKNQNAKLQESNTSLRREYTNLEEKVKFLSKSLEEKKTLLASKIINEKATPEYINQLLNEKKIKEDENAMLKAKMNKMNDLLSTYDNDNARQTEELSQTQQELQSFKDERRAYKKDLKELNEILANLNRDKVNLMREMSILQDERDRAEGESKKYKQIIEEMQNEISNYQVQMDGYAKVLKSMEAQMARIDSKAKLIAKAPLNETASTTDVDPDDHEILNKIRFIRSKADLILDNENNK